MPSSYSVSLRFELQFPGEGINTWGDKLNGVFQRIDTSIAGWTTIALTANYALSTANGSADEARSAVLKFTGAGPFSVTIPAVSKRYEIWNACSGALTITTGAGATVVIDAGDIVAVICDGSNVKTLGYGGLSLKAYIAAAALTATGTLPATTGNEGKALIVRSLAATWDRLATTDLSDYETSIKGLQVALAVSL